MANCHEIEVYVRFSETDALGHVNNTSHFLYFEEARTKFCKKVYPNKPDAFTFIIANINCSYLNESFSNQTLKVTTEFKKAGTTSFTIKQVLKNEEKNLMIAEAETVIVCFDYPKRKTIKVPDVLYDNLKKY